MRRIDPRGRKVIRQVLKQGSAQSNLFGWLAWPFLVACGLIIGVAFFRLRSHTGADFLTFLDGAHAFSLAPLSLYGPRVLSTMLGFLYPPPSILLFLPLLHLPPARAYDCFVVLIYATSAAALLLWVTVIRRSGTARRTVTRLDYSVLIALGLSAGPVFENAWDGQVNTIVLCLCAAYVLLIILGRSGWAGVVLAMGFWIKLYPALLLIHAWRYSSRSQFLLGFVAAGIIVPLMGLTIVPAALYLKYFMQAAPVLSAHLMINISNESAAAFMTRLHVPIREALETYHAYAIAPVARGGIMACALGIMGWMLGAAGRSGRDSTLVAASIIAMIAPISPLGWGHTYVYILPLLMVGAVMALTQRAWWSVAGVGGVLMLVSIPAQHVFVALSALPEWLQNSFYSRDFFATMGLEALTWRLRRVAAVPASQSEGAAGFDLQGRSPAGGTG